MGITSLNTYIIVEKLCKFLRILYPFNLRNFANYNKVSNSIRYEITLSVPMGNAAETFYFVLNHRNMTKKWENIIKIFLFKSTPGFSEYYKERISGLLN